jgi:hypothetical protein
MAGLAGAGTASDGGIGRPATAGVYANLLLIFEKCSFYGPTFRYLPKIAGITILSDYGSVN